MTTFTPLKQRYKKTIQPRLQKELRLDNIHQVPRLVKVTVNRGLGEAAQNSKALEGSTVEMARITGQKPLSPAPRRPFPASRSVRECRLASW